MLIRQSGNAKIQPGKPGYFEAAAFVPKLEMPARLDRADGDVHAAGNPHIQTDPRNIAAGRRGAGAQRLAELDPANAAHLSGAHADFTARWKTAIQRWEKEAAPLAGMPIVVQHKAFPYLEQLARTEARSRRSSPNPASNRAART